MQTRIEAVFLAAADPTGLGRFLEETTGITESGDAPDGQRGYLGLGAYLGLEPESFAAPDGAVTIWLRVDDVDEVVGRMTARGGVVVSAPVNADAERTAVILTPQGHRLGLIGDATAA